MMTSLNRRIDALERRLRPTYAELERITADLPPAWWAWLGTLTDDVLERIIEGDDLTAILDDYDAPQDDLRQAIEAGPI